MGGIAHWDDFDFIQLVGQRVQLKDDVPVKLKTFVGVEGFVMEEPIVNKTPKKNDMSMVKCVGT